MKVSLKHLIVAAVAASALFMTGCSNVNDVEKQDEKCSVSISYVNGAETRQINPVQWSSDDLKKITIEGVSSFGTSLSATTLTFDATTKKATVTLAYAPWQLTLKAYSDAEGTNLVLVGKTAVDLTNGGSEISFVLSTEDVVTLGGVDLSCSYTAASNKAEIKKIKFGLYDRISRAVVNDKDSVSTEKTIDVPAEKAYEYTASNIEPGNYVFMVTFYGNDDCSKVIGNWSDLVKVAPGKTTTQTVSIPDVIMEPPAAPENLMAWYVSGSEKDNHYKVRLTWEDKSYNEDNFIITVKEYTSNNAATTTTYKVLGVEADDSAKKEVFFTSPARVDGSIFANNTEAVLSLPTGKLFDITISAQNFAGISSECARVASTAVDGYDAIAVDSGKRINKIRLTYIFENATMAASATKNYYGSYTEYKEWASGDEDQSFDLLTVNSATANPVVYPTIVNSSSRDFKNWKTAADETGTKVTAHTTYADATYYAEFNLTYTVGYSIEDFKTLADENVSVTYDVSGTATAVAGASLKNTDTITVTFTNTDSAKYDYYQVLFDGYTRYEGDSSVTTFKAGAGVTGTKTILVMARVKDTADTWVGKSITATFGN